ncbi:phage protein NinX family protein [Burkholderia ubonensis]|uniref:phage protein NinX family protein n=1 Tax=Burkholderia ubonensis TaxID=101571 RepID=UPI00075B8E0C|nr:phage protein NinX family protein [Burkholderia ubonensis]KVC81366.1 hypothetical protein WI75_08420 [Burkholderia ubonensis]
MRVAELEGALLDYWVAKADGKDPIIYGNEDDDVRGHYVALSSDTSRAYAPSSFWEQGGPIIERERIEVGPADTDGWEAIVCQRMEHHPVLGIPTGIHLYKKGATPLIAAMRAFVASKFGDEVGDAQPKSAS